jgi:type VI protein secretion system component VasK
MTSDQTPQAIADALQPLLDEAELLRTDVHAAEDARRLSTKVNLGMLGLLVVLVLVLIGISYQNNQLGRQVAKTNTTLTDCTVPGGGCYDTSRAQTGKAIADLIRADSIVSECARLWPGESGAAYDAKLEACVYTRLAQPAGPATTATPKAGG